MWARNGRLRPTQFSQSRLCDSSKPSEAERQGGTLELRRDPVLVDRVSHLVDHGPERGAHVTGFEASRDPQVGDPDPGRERVHGLVDPPGPRLERQARRDLPRELDLPFDREVAVEARRVDALRSARDLRQQLDRAVADSRQHGLELRGAHPGLEVVEQRVVRVLGLEALDVATLELDHALEVREEGGEVGAFACVLPGALGE